MMATKQLDSDAGPKTLRNPAFGLPAMFLWNRGSRLLSFDLMLPVKRGLLLSARARESKDSFVQNTSGALSQLLLRQPSATATPMNQHLETVQAIF